MVVAGVVTQILDRAPSGQMTSADDSTLAVGLVLLAAGRASRMGDGAGHKLLAEFEGEPLIRKMARMALSSRAETSVVVIGYRAADMAKSLSGLAVELVENADFLSGMASSLKLGLGALPEKLAGALIVLGDMPALRRHHLDALIAVFVEHQGRAIVRACDGERCANPVILPRSSFEHIMRLSGDVGARALVESGQWPVINVEIGPAARLDVDTPEAVLAAGGVLEGHKVP